MAVESKASVKSRFETNDTPTGGDFGNLIDSYQDVFDVLQAIGTAAQSGKFGVIEIQSSAAVTALPVADGGRTLLAASADSSQAGIQVALAASEASARAATGITGSGAVIESGDLKQFLRPSTDVMMIPAASWILDLTNGPSRLTVRAGTTANTPCMSCINFKPTVKESIHFNIIHPNSVPDGANLWEFQLEALVTSASSAFTVWEIGVSDGIPADNKFDPVYSVVTAQTTNPTSLNNRRRYSAIVSVTASSNKESAIFFRIETNTADSNNTSVFFSNLYVRFPVSAHNED